MVSPSRRSATRASLPLLLCLGLAACGSSSSSSGTSGGSGDTKGQAPYTTAAMGDQGDLRVAFPARVTTVDPLQAGSATDIAVTQLLAGNLYAFGADGGDETAPSLASSGDFGAGDRSFTVTLKPGLSFSDGSPLTSKDVVATIKRAQTFKANAWAGTFKPIKSVRAQGTDKVRFTFTRPFPSFTTLLAYPNYGILKAGEIGKAGKLPAVPVMAGQYAAAGGALTGNGFELKRNPHAVVPPAPASLAFTVVTDPNARLQQLGDKQFDFAFDLEASALSKPPAGVLPKYPPTYGFSVLLMNHKQDPFGDVRVRKAVSMALDRSKVSQVSWSGLEQPLGGFFPTSYKGASAKAVAPDVDGAKQMLEGTKCAAGCKVALTVPTGLAWAPTAGVIIQSDLKKIGIDVSIASVDLATLFQKQFSLRYGMALSYYSDYTTIPEGLPGYCFDEASGALGCSTGYASKEGSRLVTEASEASGDKRAQAYRDLQTLYAKDVPFAPLTDYSYTSATADKASGAISSTPAGFIQVAPLKG